MLSGVAFKSPQSPTPQSSNKVVGAAKKVKVTTKAKKVKGWTGVQGFTSGTSQAKNKVLGEQIIVGQLTELHQL